MIVPAIAFIDRLASSRRMFSFGAWARLPSYPTPGGGGDGVPTRGKYHVVEEPAAPGYTGGPVPEPPGTPARIACGSRSRIGDEAGSNVECFSTLTSPNPLFRRCATSLSKIASGRCPGG